MMCTRLAARPAAGGAAGFSGFCICFCLKELFLSEHFIDVNKMVAYPKHTEVTQGNKYSASEFPTYCFLSIDDS